VTDLRPGVLFDVDGTLLDTNYLQVLAWWQALRDTGHAGVSMSALHRAIGIASDELVRHVVGEDDARAVSVKADRYAPLRDQVVAFPRAADLLVACRERGLAVVLATSGRAEDLEWMLPAIGVDDGVIDGATTSADVDGAKPRPDLLQVAARDNGLDPARTAVVGDTVWDVEAARRAGFPCAALLCGGISHGELVEAGAASVHDDPGALLDDLDGSPLGRLLAAG
jgi:HAD superfamily hydrolase (TIGR01549 family)